ncbi:cupin domain-containing protein [Lichenibacterium minor]|uniref:Cupin domain-containing protein n=1 Tax=Lichenibacterium minor TaxID=2316528 RepID=A0A4Q2U9H8_9HYPH|nr:cupin domain-containing protein [Lichenibacterium minor]RYC31676.1 cupin domain-containing protein [Lichenibacterium minor]
MSDPIEKAPGDPRREVAGFALSRRAALGAGAAAGLGLVAGAAQAQSRATTLAGMKDASATDPGPENGILKGAFPASDMPPASDHGTVKQFWSSMTLSHRRIQEGGWARQVNVVDFPISKDLAGVNMRLEAGGIRELHWHATDEWALMLTGAARITALDGDGHPFVKDVKAGDLWYFPQGLPHSIQGLGPDGCEFLLVFDDGSFSEDDTTLLSDWLIHTPRDLVAKNLGVDRAALKSFDDIPPNGRYIFPAPVPPALSQDAAAMTKHHPMSTVDFSFSMLDMKPTKQDANGSVRIVDSRNFAVSRNIAAAYVVIKPGATRSLHWHQNADEWQFWISGKGRMTLFANHSDARTIDFNPSDVGYAPATLPHYIENTGTDDLVYLEMFKAPAYQDVSLNNWLAALPPELVKQHLGLSDETLAAIPKDNLAILPPGRM